LIAATGAALQSGEPSMAFQFALTRLGKASALTQSAGGTLFLEDNMIFKYDPI
jgi:hypothetical protein